MVAVPAAVLVADDEPQLLRVLVRVLERSGYRVVQASDAERAIGAFDAAADEIRVAVVDAAIGPAGSDALLEHIASRRPGVGIVVTSGDGLRETARSRLNERNGIFLHKPFSPSALLRAVEDSMARGV